MIRYPRTCLVFLGLLSSAFAFAGEKVAIIVNGSDTAPMGLSEHFDKTENNAAQLYSKNGYRIIRIDSDKGMGAKEFRKALSELKDVDEVSLSFFTHGSVRNDGDSFYPTQPLSSDDLKRFPKSYLRPDELEIQVAGEKLASPVRYAFAMQNPYDYDPKVNSQWIGLGDLHDSLASLKHSNPKVKVNITALSCFGSNATRSLQDIPDVQVFTGGAASQSSDISLAKERNSEEMKKNYEAIDLREVKVLDSFDYKDRNDFVRFFNQELNDGNSYLEAFSKGRDLYLKEKLRNFDMFHGLRSPFDSARDFLIRPQSSLELLLADECLGHPPRTEVTPYCLMPEDSRDLLKGAPNMLRPVLSEYLSKQVGSDDQHLYKLSVLFGCDEKDRAQESESLRMALMEAKKEMESQLLAINQADFDSAAKRVASKLELIQKAETANELIKLVENNQQGSTLVTNLKHAREEGAEAEKFFIDMAKDQLFSQAQVTAENLGRPTALATLRERIIQNIREMNDHSSEYSKCLSNPLDCDARKALNIFIDESEFPNRQHNYDMEARVLVNKSCPSSIVAGSNLSQIKAARAQQLQCIKDHTKDSALLRVHSLFFVNMKASSEDRNKACSLFAQEKAKNEKLHGCLSSPQFGDDEFWKTMNSQFVQGETSLVSKKSN